MSLANRPFSVVVKALKQQGRPLDVFVDEGLNKVAIKEAIRVHNDRVDSEQEDETDVLAIKEKEETTNRPPPKPPNDCCVCQ